MATISYEDLEKLAEIIIKHIEKEFEIKHLSKNLVNTIEVQATNEKIDIIIPAKTYNMLLFQTKGVIVHTGHGSYASKLDKEGSEFYSYHSGSRKGSKKIKPGNHKGYVDRVIMDAIGEWMSISGRFDEKKVTEFGG